MFDNITPRTIHYSGDSTTLRKKTTFEAVFPFVMIAIGLAGICMIMFQ